MTTNQFKAIVDKKLDLRDNIIELRNLVYCNLFEYYDKGLKQAEITQKIKKDILYSNLRNRCNIAILWLSMAILIKKVFRKKDTNILLQYQYMDFTNSSINQIVNEYEKKEKEKALKYIVENRKFPFVLCSFHKDSAEDHEYAQGKIYVKSSCLKDDEVLNLTTDRGIQTIEYIVNAPVYLITRPNCRHYLREITLEEVRDNTEDELLKKYDMISEVGKHGVKYISGESVSQIRKYKERLELLRRLKEIKKNDEVETSILNTKMLLNQWEMKYNKEKR